MHLFEHEIKFLDHIISKDDTPLNECMPIGHYFSQNESMDIESPPRSIACDSAKLIQELFSTKLILMNRLRDCGFRFIIHIDQQKRYTFHKSYSIIKTYSSLLAAHHVQIYFLLLK